MQSALKCHGAQSTAAVILIATPVGFEPTRGDPIGLAGRRLSRSAKVSYAIVDKLFESFARQMRSPSGQRHQDMFSFSC